MITVRKVYKFLSVIITIYIFFCISTYAQDIPSSIKDELNEYERQIDKNNNNQQLEVEYLNKAAFLCWNNQLHQKSIGYFKRVLDLNKKLGNQNGIFLSSNYLGMIYDEIQDYNSAIVYFKKSLEICRIVKNKRNITSSLVNISQTYQSLKDYDNSNTTAVEGLDVAKEINDLKLVRTFYGILANNYQSLGNSEKSIEYFDLFASIDKYLKKEEIKDIKQESETKVNKAEEEKKQTEAELEIQTDKLKETADSLAQVEKLTKEQQMEIELKESELREQLALRKLDQLVIKVLVIGLVVIFIFFAILITFYRKIRNQKNQIEEQRDKLDIQNKKINSSIQYAQNIQRAILPIVGHIRNLFENFILYRPKDIVSGDFYWFSQLKDMVFVAAVDCTGHGVPGAFMSMIGNSLLNEIVLEKKVTDPAKILSLLNEKIVESLRQNETENNDGMDVCLTSINTKTNEIKFSGAKRPLFMYKQGASELNEIKGDRISIGGMNKKTEDKNFSTHTVQANSGDIIYLSSDGLTDQNNSERKRYGSNRLKELILKNISEPMDRQKEIIEDDLDFFQNNEEQRDDITLIGIKF